MLFFWHAQIKLKLEIKIKISIDTLGALDLLSVEA
jgi:hypothetical protein